MVERKLPPWYLSFATEKGWLGACVVRGADDQAGELSPDNPVVVAHREGCNPGGEVMLIRLDEEKAEQIPAEFWNTLLSEDDLAAVGQIVDPEASGFERGSADELRERLEGGQ